MCSMTISQEGSVYKELGEIAKTYNCPQMLGIIIINVLK